MRHQTTVGAARDLLISQPAVSNGLRHLENQLGFQLFDRLGNRLSPREEARILFEQSEAIFLLSKALDQTVDDLRNHRLGHVRIVATPQLGHTVVPAAIQRFLVGRTDVKIVFDVRQSHYVVESVETGTADLGLALALDTDLTGTLSLSTIGAVEMVCVLPHHHPLATHSSISPGDLRNVCFIGLDLGTKLGPVVSEIFRSAQEEYRPSVEVRYSETACLLAQSGAGVAVVDAFSASSYLESPRVKVRPFRPRTTVQAVAVLPKGRTPSTLASSLLQMIQEEASLFF